MPPEQLPLSPVKPSLPSQKVSWAFLTRSHHPSVLPPHAPHPTYIVLDQLLDGVELGAGGDVVAPIVQFPNLIVLDMVSLGLVPVPDGEGVGTYVGGQGSGWVREGCSPPVSPSLSPYLLSSRSPG